MKTTTTSKWQLTLAGLARVGSFVLSATNLKTAYEVHRRNPTAVRHRCAQRCDMKNEYSAVAAKTSTAL